MSDKEAGSLVTDSELKDLPDPVQRYMSFTGVLGKPWIHNVVLKQAGRYIGAASANAVNLLDPEVLILGGGLVNAGGVLVESIRQSLKQYTMMGISEDIEIRVSNLGVDSSALGIALMAMDRIFVPAVSK